MKIKIIMFGLLCFGSSIADDETCRQKINRLIEKQRQMKPGYLDWHEGNSQQYRRNACCFISNCASNVGLCLGCCCIRSIVAIAIASEQK